MVENLCRGNGTRTGRRPGSVHETSPVPSTSPPVSYHGPCFVRTGTIDLESSSDLPG